ncbi:RING finger protein B-like, partial [Myzus persicae]|uniref:RING finger protein B-like n=1 Tax=Myzus persicae TaxID=13164 RepID=UPI000B9373CA
YNYNSPNILLFLVFHLIHWLDDEEEEEENIPRPVLPNNTYISLEDLTIEPIISESCYICHYSTPTVIALPCRHQGLCAPCHQTYIMMPPYRTIPYYRCPLCRGEITTYFIIV